jgi:hypothetical protein
VGWGWGMDEVSAQVEEEGGRPARACEMKKMGSFGPESGLGRWLELELDDVNERGVPFSPAGICGGWRSSFS